MRDVPLSFNGRTPGFDPGNDGSEPSDGASVFSLFFPFYRPRPWRLVTAMYAALAQR